MFYSLFALTSIEQSDLITVVHSFFIICSFNQTFWKSLIDQGERNCINKLYKGKRTIEIKHSILVIQSNIIHMSMWSSLYGTSISFNSSILLKTMRMCRHSRIFSCSIAMFLEYFLNVFECRYHQKWNDWKKKLINQMV